jgi:hypothetical protein
MQAGHRRPSQLAVRCGPWKLIHTRSRADRYWLGLPELALFNLAADPGELKNVIDQHPELTAELRGALDRWLAGSDDPHPAQAAEINDVEPATREMIRILGYGG